MTLTFSEFAQLLYQHCGWKDTKAEFVVTLTNKMMERPGVRICDASRNPLIDKLDADPDYVLKFFNGRNLTEEDRRIILGCLKKERFEKFIQIFSEDAQKNIAMSLTTHGVSDVTLKNVDQKCADIFEAILINGKYEETGSAEKQLFQAP